MNEWCDKIVVEKQRHHFYPVLKFLILDLRENYTDDLRKALFGRGSQVVLLFDIKVFFILQTPG